MDSEHVNVVERDVSGRGDKEETSDQKRESPHAESTESERRETSATTVAGLGLKGLQPLPSRVSLVFDSILIGLNMLFSIYEKSWLSYRLRKNCLGHCKAPMEQVHQGRHKVSAPYQCKQEMVLFLLVVG